MTDPEIADVLRQRIDAVQERMNASCQRAGRDLQTVRLVAVTKTVSPRVAGLLPGLGIFDLGESRPQELWRKAESLSQHPIRWHFIGHMQRNKVERTLPEVHLFHTVDSLRLFDEVVLQGTKLGLTPRVLLQVNVSREPQKSGFSVEELPGLQESLVGRPVEIAGLMAMAAYADDPELARPAFHELSQLRDQLRGTWGLPLPELSMGMSGDFEVGIEEGSTLVRIGSTLFEGLDGE